MYCPLCGTPNGDGAVNCTKCGYNFQPAASSPAATSEAAAAPVSQPSVAPQPTWQEQPDSGQTFLPQQWAPPSYLPQTYGQMPPGQSNDSFSALIPYKNSSALIAYYLAVFSLIPCFGLVGGIAAFVLGLKGLKFAKLHPEAKGKAHAWVGIILGGLCGLANILIILVRAIMAALSSH